MVCKLDTGIQSAEENMKVDAELLKGLSKDPVVHLYDWAGPSITHGYFIDPKKHLSLEVAAKQGVSLARRPTGGGLVFHLWDYAFSFLMPSSHKFFSLNTLDNYKFVNKVVLDVVRAIFPIESSVHLLPESMPMQGEGCGFFCMARPTQYDVVFRGRKIAGAAQRRTKEGYLHQGTISLVAPDVSLLEEILLDKEAVVEAMGNYSFSPLTKEDLGKYRKEIGEALFQAFKKRCEE